MRTVTYLVGVRAPENMEMQIIHAIESMVESAQAWVEDIQEDS